MDWNALIGRWPPEPDALRLLLVIDRLGHDATDGRALVGESSLRHLDHLVDQPRTLAYVLLDRFASERALRDERGTWADATRQLVADERTAPRRRGPDVASAGGGFEPPRWRRLDGALVFLSSRGLIRVDLGPDDALRFTSIGDAASLLDRANELPWLERRARRCAAIAAHLPERTGDALLERMRSAARRLQGFRRSADLPPERDPLPELFHATFRERL
ncbi:MAG: hypothetical protein AAGE94_17220 [Acidobacteriota bacterium]